MAQEIIMSSVRLCCRYVGMLGVMLALLGCTFEAAVQQLPTAEQTEFQDSRKVRTSTQVRAYLAMTTATERAASLNDLGLAQRFQALDVLDREALLTGQPRWGMSAEALRFLWGDPYYMEGRRSSDEHWYYPGSSFSLGARGNDVRRVGSRAVVDLVDGRVRSWRDVMPMTNE